MKEEAIRHAMKKRNPMQDDDCSERTKTASALMLMKPKKKTTKTA